MVTDFSARRNPPGAPPDQAARHRQAEESAARLAQERAAGRVAFGAAGAGPPLLHLDSRQILAGGGFQWADNLQPFAARLTAPFPFPIAALPPTAADPIAAAARLTGVDLGVAAVAGLAVYSTLVCGDFRLHTPGYESNDAAPPALFLAALCESGYGKSSAAAHLWRPMQRANIAAADDWKAAKEAGETVTALSPEATVSDATAQALSWVLDQGRHTQAVLTAEAREWLEGWNARSPNRKNLNAMLCRAWSGEPLEVVRKTDKERFYSHNRSLAVGMMAQHEGGAGFLAGAGSDAGLFARFLVTLVDADANPAKPDRQDSYGKILERYAGKITAIRARQDRAMMLPGKPQHRRIGLTDAALERHDEIAAGARQTARDASGLIKGWILRHAEHSLRLAAVLKGYTRLAAEPVRAPLSLDLDSDDVAAGFELAQYFRIQAQRLAEYGAADDFTAAVADVVQRMAAIDPMAEDAKAKGIFSRGRGIALNQLMATRCIPALRKNARLQSQVKAWLLESGYIVISDANPARCWLNPNA